MVKPSTLERDISPPRARRQAEARFANGAGDEATDQQDDGQAAVNSLKADPRPTLAAIEAGEARIDDHLGYFASHLRATLRPSRNTALSIDALEALYRRNQHKHGRHFVVHQHDHPISGVHYDLRLQFSDSSTISFAIPYGLPGNANSVRPNRMAIETRVHTLWNNLIEAASHATGSLLIWDTGEYEVLPWKKSKNDIETDDETSDGDPGGIFAGESQSERLFECFQKRRIRLRLHGSRLPHNYTISLWLPSSNERRGQPKKPRRKRRRIDPKKELRRPVTPSDSDNEEQCVGHTGDPDTINSSGEAEDAGLASDNDEDETIRHNNAYPGASNTIGSIHQRNWMLTLDKQNSGFRKARTGPNAGRWFSDCESFFVRGRDYERSIVTGRDADEVMEDEGVEKFVGRKMWRPILE